MSSCTECHWDGHSTENCPRFKKYVKTYTQSEVERLCIEAKIEELEKLLVYAKNIPDVGIRYPEEEEKYREFARASVVMTNYASTRLESLKQSKKEEL